MREGRVAVRVLYLDCIGGIAGDMTLAALVDAGADAAAIREALASLPLEPFELTQESVDVHGVVAQRITVETQTAGIIRTYASIRTMLDQGELSEGALRIAQRIFQRLAQAEAVVHRKEIDQVTFHEVGAVDSIVDIAGTAVALDLLGIERVYASPVPTGFGLVRTEHGAMPIPAPAVVELLRGVPLYSRGVQAELTTPTGAAILAAMCEGYGEMPAMRIEATGYGTGTLELDEFPNILRALVGDSDETTGLTPGGSEVGSRTSTEVLLATNIDDLEPELLAHVVERLLEAGAQDAWLTPIIMKKGRAAVTLSALCAPEQESEMRGIVFRETGTLGVRSHEVTKYALARDVVPVETRWGVVGVKVGVQDDGQRSYAPEFEDCVRVAREADIPAREVYQEAVRLARHELPD